MIYANFRRPSCYTAVTRYAVSDDGLHWKTRNPNVIPGMDAELARAGEGLWLMAYCPRGFFDADDCDIRIAIMNGVLKDLAAGKPAAGVEEAGR